MAEEKHHHLNPVHHHGGEKHADEKEHKHKEHQGELDALAAGAFALHEKHEAKDPEHAHRHKIEEEVATSTAVESGGFAFPEEILKKANEER